MSYKSFNVLSFVLDTLQLSSNSVDWATAAVGEGDTCQLSVSFTYHSSGPIYETLAQSTEFDGSH